jgi:hypothetical protein
MKLELPIDFDIDFYKNYYTDLQHMSNNELVHHYLNYGIHENRIYKKNNENNLVKYCINEKILNNPILPIDFDIDYYREYHKDLRNMSNEELITHYINHGKNENRRYKKTIMKFRYISLGSWCGTAWSIRHNHLNDIDKQLPFDFIRSRFDGIIDCIENNFQYFYPKNIEVDIIENYSYNNMSFRGKYFGFFHHDLRDPNTFVAFDRRIKRLDDYLKNSNDKTIFVRTLLNKNYKDDINLGRTFTELINKKYPLLKYLLIFVIPEQPETRYYKNISNNIFLFTVDDIDHNLANIKDKYKKIYDFIDEHDLFNNIPESNDLVINQFNGILGEEYNVCPFRDEN